ncbi:hypothetical protein [Catellatospora citrea]|uniref:hypothetical protein n=1 Tax=Catellatospora citrea TaxID=53366 RepID=UPI000E76BBF8|nr:hypothetical protein [Catellatospora citrea]
MGGRLNVAQTTHVDGFAAIRTAARVAPRSRPLWQPREPREPLNKFAEVESAVQDEIVDQWRERWRADRGDDVADRSDLGSIERRLQRAEHVDLQRENQQTR